MSLPMLVQSNSEQHLHLLKAHNLCSYVGTQRGKLLCAPLLGIPGRATWNLAIISEKLRLIYVRAVDNVCWQKAFLVKNGKAVERRI